MASARDEWVAASSRFAAIWQVGKVPAHLLEGPPAHLDVEASDSVSLDVQAIVRCAQRVSGGRTALILCGSRLRTRECPDLLGYADRRARVVVLSTSAMQSDQDPELLLARLRNVLAHEQGHLDGRSHCRTAGCVMRPVSEAAYLDARPLVPCERCRRPRFRRAAPLVAAAAALALAVLLFDGVASRLVGPAFEMPFT